MKFQMAHKRWPTWVDAMEHCTLEMRNFWTLALAEKGIDIARSATPNPAATPRSPGLWLASHGNKKAHFWSSPRKTLCNASDVEAFASLQEHRPGRQCQNCARILVARQRFKR
ncbi:MAG: hypothetical protein K8R92_00895 [Planctomycetes bacterium]|nr:hypothetical protein [Planctomycetota bacterium]